MINSEFQTKQEELLRQQEILKGLGYYTGAIDGIWSDLSIAAMRLWERNPSFKPALPNSGLPLSISGKLPQGVTKDSVNRSLLYHPILDKKEEVDIKKAKKDA